MPADVTSPNITTLMRRSHRLAQWPGLPQQALRWHQDAAARRAALAREAEGLARPRIWPDTLLSAATLGARAVLAAAPSAPLHLVRVAGASAGVRIEPRGDAALLRRVQGLVRQGGPTYIKLGQFIATADGLLPPEWVEAFRWCRDEAPPLPDGVARGIIEAELGDQMALVEWLDEEPLAAGSIGQVHRGRLTDGTEVVVKVRRPGLRRRFVSDIETLALLAAAADKLNESVRAANLPGFVSLFAQLALEELDFRLEAANLVDSIAVLETLDEEQMRSPRPVPGMVTERVLVMEHLPGVSYARIDPAREIDGERLLALGIQGVLEATLTYGVFHGDLHAGNVLVTDTGGFSLVDFGIVGRMDEKQRGALVSYLAAWAESDAAGQIEAMREFGAVGPDVHTDHLVAELQHELDVLRDRSRGPVTFDQLGITLGRLLQILARNGFTMPRDLVLFFKNLLYLGGFAASVAPHVDVLEMVQGILVEALMGTTDPVDVPA